MKHPNTKTAITILLWLTMVGYGISNALATPIADIVFDDANLKHCIDSYQHEDTDSFTQLNCDNHSITSIAALSNFTTLQYLYLRNNQISDISPLVGMTGLQVLYLYNNQISNISPLVGMTGLQYLHLSYNQISDISSLAGMTGLVHLYLYNNQISDISLLAGIIGLQYLGLSNNQIGDISPLAGMTGLWFLYLDNNQISDISPLAGMTGLQDLSLSNNQISDISPLAGITMTDLWFLYLDDNKISNISPLSGLLNLQQLYLDNNHISDISPLSGLINLQQLYLDNNQISDISPLSALVNLVGYLDLSNNQISDIHSLSALVNLRVLDLSENNGILCVDLDNLAIALPQANITRPSQCITASACNLDIDNNGGVDALTDGLLALRYEFGFSGDNLINGAIAPNAQRQTASAIADYLLQCGNALDIDNNGGVDALTDGLLTLRYEFGFSGENLINGAIAPNAQRATAAAIEAYLQGLGVAQGISK